MIYAKYTIVLKTLLDDPQSKELIDKAMSTYPLYTPENAEKFSKVMTRSEINSMILNHFKYREIGFETFGRFLDELEISLNEIMPYYNQLLCSQDIINGLEDIFGNLDVTEEFDQETSGSSNTSSSEEVEGSGSSTASGSDSSTSTTSMNGNVKNVKSETPQSQISITANNIDNVTYADQVDWNKNESTSNGSTSGNTSSESSTTNNQSTTGSMTGSSEQVTKHTLHRKGNQGVNTYAHDMLEFRQLFVNVVQDIIKDPRIQELFMLVY